MDTSRFTSVFQNSLQPNHKRFLPANFVRTFNTIMISAVDRGWLSNLILNQESVRSRVLFAPAGTAGRLQNKEVFVEKKGKL